MKAQTILTEDIEALKVSSLPNRPTAPEEYGGVGFSAKQMKEAFDALPLYIIERFNELIDDIVTEGEDSISHVIKVGLGEEVSLYDFADWFYDGRILSFIPYGGTTLADFLDALRNDVDRCINELGI